MTNPSRPAVDLDYLAGRAPYRGSGGSIYHGHRRKKSGEGSSEKAIAAEVNRCRARIEADRRRRAKGRG